MEPLTNPQKHETRNCGRNTGTVLMFPYKCNKLQKYLLQEDTLQYIA